MNPDGGLKSFGHPIGASGLRMMYEMWLQLRGEAGPRQIEDPKLGLTHNLGGQPGRCVSFVSIVGNTSDGLRASRRANPPSHPQHASTTSNGSIGASPKRARILAARERRVARRLAGRDPVRRSGDRTHEIGGSADARRDVARDLDVRDLAPRRELEDPRSRAARAIASSAVTTCVERGRAPRPCRRTR